MNKKISLALVVICCAGMLLLGVCIGSVSAPPGTILQILTSMIFSRPLPDGVDSVVPAILFSIRLPRVCCAFLAGGALAACGTVMQSILQNPLASSYTLGVSSGASLGAAVVMVSGFTLPAAAFLTLPLFGFLFGFGTVLLAMGLALRADQRFQNHTIILIGMVLSLFINACLTLLSTLRQDFMQQMFRWQMGSFASKGWEQTVILFIAVCTGTCYLYRYVQEMDQMTFGEESAQSIGVNTRMVKWKLLIAASLLTGTTVCFTGTIGFIDLVAPHVVRKIFGPAHRYVLPISVIFGGTFMVAADMVARTVLSPMELPVGAVTALMGAPFFVKIYFGNRKKK